MPDLLVGLDVGTSSVKAAVCTAEGQELAHGSAPLAWRTTPLGTETDPERVLSTVRAALADALARAPEGQVIGLGVAGMAESGVLLGPDGRPVAPLIAWHDSRDRDQAARLAADLGEEEFAAATGLPLGTQWSLTKHRWMREHDDRIERAVRRLNVGEWVVHALGGEQASEYSLASRTGWLHLRDRTWWEPTLEWAGADRALLPPLVQAGTPLGRAVRDRAGDRLAGAVLTVAGHDHQAAAVGAAATGDGDVLDSCGTAEALVRTVPAPLPEPAVVELTRHGVTVGWHALPGRLSVLGATRGGLLLQHVLRLLGRDRDDLPELDRTALETEPGPLRVRLADDGTATVSGAGRDGTPAAVWRAALDEATAELERLQQIMTAAAGPYGQVVMTGGWAHSEAMVELRRRAFGNARRSTAVQAGARGAALLAGQAAGVRTAVTGPVPGPSGEYRVHPRQGEEIS
ncbi:FGGY-family carbohydrate kinase [Actinoallomurus iriomotensis]|uniref:FGGY-family carbohydrate kinase n=1 Tax=Actinoallomurus iriomotensis TaxID=478107 RepID=UPI00255592F1|nr:FGGY family carbohydrate kinase [Actinoallomurus iriomotensis]